MTNTKHNKFIQCNFFRSGKYSGKKEESICWVLETQFAGLNRVAIEKVRSYQALEGGET